ncbi:MAG TPA: FAD-dependent monooxygenase [Roseiarcus sp.]|nr:FAD-dependent monooxygenase [Roseiarcus sp.]
MSGRALIAGAGIGGLTAAIALGRAGFDIAIFERAERLEEIGAGLQLTPNATRILDKLDLLETVERRALAPRAIRIFRGRDGAKLVRLPLEARERWGAPYLVLRRADLQSALAGRAAAEPRIKLSLGMEAAGCGEDEAGVLLGLTRGAIRLAERGDLLIGADGISSAIRERLGFGDRNSARFSGRIAFRATIAAKAAPAWCGEPDVSLHLGAKAHLVHYPVAGGAEINIVAVIEAGWRDRPGEDPWDGEADAAALRAAFAGWSKAARALIAAPREWRAWPLRERPALDRLAVGRVALLGDAAHPMLPFLAQGAGQAIEDAGALAECLAASNDIAEALAAYSRRRAARVARVQRESETQARLYHMAGPLALARDFGMRALGAERLLRRYDWIYRA